MSSDSFAKQTMRQKEIIQSSSPTWVQLLVKGVDVEVLQSSNGQSLLPLQNYITMNTSAATSVPLILVNQLTNQSRSGVLKRQEPKQSFVGVLLPSIQAEGKESVLVI